MNKSEQKLIYGIGSPNGDDQIGWKVIERIRTHLHDGWQAKSGLVPMDLLNHLEGICELHIVDACEGEEEIGTTHRLEWPRGATRLQFCFNLSRFLVENDTRTSRQPGDSP